jgi:hypothetical protein
VRHFYVRERYLNDYTRIEHVDGRTQLTDCLQNPLNVVDLKYCAVKLELLLEEVK